MTLEELAASIASEREKDRASLQSMWTDLRGSLQKMQTRLDKLTAAVIAGNELTDSVDERVAALEARVAKLEAE